jgi:hypothetical protein
LCAVRVLIGRERYRAGSQRLDTDLEVVCPDNIDGFAAGTHMHLFHNAVNVIADGELREVELRGDFLVREALRDKIHELTLAKSKVGPG